MSEPTAADGWIVADRLRRWLLAPTPRLRILAAAGALLLIAALFYFGTQSAGVDALGSVWDWIRQFALFVMLGPLLAAALGGRGYALVLVLCALVGGTDELAHSLQLGRAVELGAWVAEVSGAAVAGLIVHLLRGVASARTPRVR